MTIQTADFTKPNAPKIFVQSLKETGFGIIKNHPINYCLISEVYKEWEDFFKSPSKFDYTFSKETQDGYFPYLSENAKNSTYKDLKEFYHLYSWGKYPQNLSSKTKDLLLQMNTLATTLLNWIESEIPSTIKEGFSLPLSKMIENSNRTLLRIIYYPPLKKGEENSNALRSAAHEDIDLLTLLPAATSSGLQVKDKEDNWLTIESDPGTMIINVGDMLQMCSQNYFQSTTHRVINPQGDEAQKARLSMPLFLHPRDEVQLCATHSAKSYLEERLREIGLM